MLKNSELKWTHSTVLSRNGRNCVAVLIERGQDMAEGSVPDCIITTSRGFSEAEIAELEDMLRENRQNIIDAAKSITTLSNMMR